jgi:hypothetical protein
MLDELPYFMIISERTISSDLFNSLLSDRDLSGLLQTCKGMKTMVLQWKNIFPIETFQISWRNNDEDIKKIILYYSCKIKKLKVDSLCTIDGYHHLTLLHPYLTDLSIQGCINLGLRVVSFWLKNLTSLSLFYSPSVSSEDVDSLSKLTKLEKIRFDDIENLNDAAVANYSTLYKIMSMNIAHCGTISGLGLSRLMAKKDLLTDLDIYDCKGISSKGYHCLTSLNNLTNLEIVDCKLENFSLNLICSHCLLIEHLVIYANDKITQEGLNNIHYLTCLSYLSVDVRGSDWLPNLPFSSLLHLYLSSSDLSNEGIAPLSSFTNLTELDLNGCDITVEGLSYLSSLTNLTILDLKYCETITDEGLLHLPSLTSLTEIDLSGCDITDEGLLHVRSKLTNLKKLELKS